MTLKDLRLLLRRIWQPAELGANLLAGLAYLSLTLPVTPMLGGAPDFRPAASLGALCILLSGTRWLPGLFAGAFTTAYWFLGQTTGAALLEALGSVLGPLAALGGLRLLDIERRRIFDTVAGVAAFALLPGVLNAAIAGFFGAAALAAAAETSVQTFADRAAILAIAHGSSVLVLTPALYMWAHPPEAGPARSRTETAGIAILTVLLCLLLFWMPLWIGEVTQGAIALIVLPTIWAALRFSRRYAATLVAAVFLLGISGTLLGRGTLGLAPAAGHPLTGAELRVFALAIAVLIAAALSREREHFAHALVRLNAGLEGKIKQRTQELEKSRAELRHQLAFQQSFLDSLPNPVFYVDLNGAYVLCSHAFQQLAGRSQASLVGCTAHDVFGPEAGALYEIQLQRLQQGGGPLCFALRLPQDGQMHDHIVSLAPVSNWQGEVLGVAGMMQDVSDMKRLEQALKENEARFRLMVETLPSPMLLARRSDGALLFANEAAVLNLGLDARALAEYRAADFWQDTAQYGALLGELDRAGLVRGRELRLLRANGEPLWLLASLARTELSGEPALILAFEDITRSKEREAELYSQATTDALTGVSNRRHFLALAQNEIQRAARSKQPWALLMVDLDHFKQVNDSFGHLCGDRVLKEVAATLQKHLRSIDLLGRLGGEEFAILLPNSGAEAAQEVAERLRLAVQNGALDAGCAKGFAVTISLGLFLQGGSDTPTDLGSCLARADAALYAAKDAGRNCVALAPAALH